MDYTRENVVHVIQTNAPENWLPNSADSSVWATEEDYRLWNNHEADTPSNSSFPRSNSEQQLNKKPRISQEPSSRSKAIGKMFFKTKLCCKFRAGTCPYVTNCNFAHSIEELRRPPPNWQDIVAANDDDKGTPPEPPREEFQIPSVVSSNFVIEPPRSYKWRNCKKFFTEEGCPYGENCTFLHDEQSKNRESVAISLGPGGYGGGGGGSGNGPNSKPTNWKTRICNKWELTGFCPFGNKCHFAHGASELHRHGDGEARDSSAATAPAPESKQGGLASKSQFDAMAPSAQNPHSDVYHLGIASQRTSMVLPRPGQRPHQKWKGPDKISRIYGDWIDDIE